MSWNNFSGDNQEEQDSQNGSNKTQEPKKLIDSVSIIDTLSDRSKELTSKILSDIDKDTGLAKQLININVTEVNRATSKETVYKTEEDKHDDYMNKVLNHNNDDLFRSVTNYSVSTERKKRYDIYEQILDSNYIAFRILMAYINNTLIKNAQTKNFLTINTPDDKADLLNYLGREVKNSYNKFNKSILVKYKLQRKLKDVIVPKTLLYGNYFAEIVDLNQLGNIADYEQIIMETTTIRTEKVKKENDADYIFESNFECFDTEKELLESIQQKTDTKSLEEASFKQNITKYENEVEEFLTSNNEVNTKFNNRASTISEIRENLLNSDTEDKMEILEEFENLIPSKPSNPYGLDALMEEVIQESSTDPFDNSFLDDFGINLKNDTKQYNLDDIHQLNFSCLKDIFINYHHPRNIVIIERDGLVYGYLIIEDDKIGSGGEYVVDRFKRFSTGLNGANGSGTTAEENVMDITEKITDEIMKKVVHNIKLSKSRTYSSSYDYFKTLDLSDEATTSLKLLIYNKIKQKSKLKFRFLTPETMVNFSTSINKFAPYGTGIFDPIVGPVKLYTLALMSSVVSRLSRAAVIRKWTIEAGEKRNHKEIVDKTKAELKSKAITYDKINNLKNISEIVTDFRDMATITINGQRYIDMEIMPMQDRGLPLNDLNDLKQDIIAGGGVPPIYLNMGDTTDLRETIVHLNVTFANDIIDKQQSIEDGMNHLQDAIFKKVLKYNDYNHSDFYISTYSEIKLNAPLVLQIQSDEAMITTVTNIIGLLEQSKFPIDPKGILKKYIPSVNWDILEKEGMDHIRKLGKKAISSGDAGDGY